MGMLSSRPGMYSRVGIGEWASGEAVHACHLEAGREVERNDIRDLRREISRGCVRWSLFKGEQGHYWMRSDLFPFD